MPYYVQSESPGVGGLMDVAGLAAAYFRVKDELQQAKDAHASTLQNITASQASTAATLENAGLQQTGPNQYTPIPMPWDTTAPPAATPPSAGAAAGAAAGTAGGGTAQPPTPAAPSGAASNSLVPPAPTSGKGGFFHNNPYPQDSPEYYDFEASQAGSWLLKLPAGSRWVTPLNEYATRMTTLATQAREQSKFVHVKGPGGQDVEESYPDWFRQTHVTPDTRYKEGDLVSVTDDQGQTHKLPYATVYGKAAPTYGETHVSANTQANIAAGYERQRRSEAFTRDVVTPEHERFAKTMAQWHHDHPNVVSVFNSSDKGDMARLKAADSAVAETSRQVGQEYDHLINQNQAAKAAGNPLPFEHPKHISDMVNAMWSDISKDPEKGYATWKKAIDATPDDQLTGEERGELTKWLGQMHRDLTAQQGIQKVIDQSGQQLRQQYGGGDDNLNPPLDWEQEP